MTLDLGTSGNACLEWDISSAPRNWALRCSMFRARCQYSRILKNIQIMYHNVGTYVEGTNEVALSLCDRNAIDTAGPAPTH